MISVTDAIYGRRSIRKYTEQKVDRETLTELIKLATAAPSARNARPWEFVVVTDEAVIDQFRKNLQYAKMNAPAAIIVCGNKKAFAEGETYWIQDCSAAMENILLGALAYDLGTVWIGVHADQEKIEVIRNAVHLPEDVVPVGMCYVGYPAEEKEPRTQYEEDLLHWDKY
ncbi:nitroreductase family protein [Anaerolentibacter hominis]|uniref:nitroreductase family protein n=1 Tax=Anaerolentibacter hominis TaxID=3079009 RepID=UPI0031B87CB1